MKAKGMLLLLATAASCLAVASAAQSAAWLQMVRALARKKGYVQFLTRLQTADAIAGFRLSGLLSSTPITIFAPTDTAFASSRRYRYVWNSRRCCYPATPQQCYIPLTGFLIVPADRAYGIGNSNRYLGKNGLLTLARLRAAKSQTWFNTWTGDGIQKFTARNAFGFILAAQVGCGRQCASKISGGTLREANIFVSKRIIVHGISALIAPPSVWPNGFN